MKKTKVFLIVGKARSGKDTVSDIIKEYYKDKIVVQISFTDYIKNYAMKITNWDGKEETKPRELLQILGTEIVRNKVNKNFFINRICEDIEVYKYFADVIIISGGRYQNEIDEPKAKFKNIIAIKVERPNFKNNLTEKQNNHLSELAADKLKNCDYIIVNDSTKEKLKEKTIKMLGEIENEHKR